MAERNQRGRIKVQERRGRSANSFSEVTVSVTLGSPSAVLSAKPVTTGVITWSFVTDPKLELIDMFVDVV